MKGIFEWNGCKLFDYKLYFTHIGIIVINKTYSMLKSSIANFAMNRQLKHGLALEPVFRLNNQEISFPSTDP